MLEGDKKDPDSEPVENDTGHVGYGFLSKIIAAGIMGYVTDKVFETAPWGLLGFMVFGFVYATYQAQRAMQPPKTD